MQGPNLTKSCHKLLKSLRPTLRRCGLGGLMLFSLLGVACKNDVSESDNQATPEAAPDPQWLKAVLQDGEAFGDFKLGKATFQEIKAELGPRAIISRSEVYSSDCQGETDCKQQHHTEVELKYDDWLTFGFTPLHKGGSENELKLESVMVNCEQPCPYQGMTGKGIRLGDSFEKAKTVYGKSMTGHPISKMVCFGHGICFRWDRQQNINRMMVMPWNHKILQEMRNRGY